jgi:hypothetical protein
MVKLRGNDVRELAWTVGGASAGSLARHWVDPVWPHSTTGIVILVAVSSTVVGVSLAASMPAPMKTALFAAGGATASLSAAATRAATATPSQSFIGVAAFVVAAVAGLLLGLSVAAVVANHHRRERC